MREWATQEKGSGALPGLTELGGWIKEHPGWYVTYTSAAPRAMPLVLSAGLVPVPGVEAFSDIAHSLCFPICHPAAPSMSLFPTGTPNSARKEKQPPSPGENVPIFCLNGRKRTCDFYSFLFINPQNIPLAFHYRHLCSFAANLSVTLGGIKFLFQKILTDILAQFQASIIQLLSDLQADSDEWAMLG